MATLSMSGGLQQLRAGFMFMLFITTFASCDVSPVSVPDQGRPPQSSVQIEANSEFEVDPVTGRITASISAIPTPDSAMAITQHGITDDPPPTETVILTKQHVDETVECSGCSDGDLANQVITVTFTVNPGIDSLKMVRVETAECVRNCTITSVESDPALPDDFAAGDVFQIRLSVTALTDAQFKVRLIVVADVVIDLTINSIGDEPDPNAGQPGDDRRCDVDLAMAGRQCTLRAAIQNANQLSIPAELGFNLGGGIPRIQVGSATGKPLPPVLNTVRINGNTGGAKSVELDGSMAGQGAIGLRIRGSDSEVSDLIIRRFSETAMQVQDATGVIIVDNSFISLDVAGVGPALKIVGGGNITITGNKIDIEGLGDCCAASNYPRGLIAQASNPEKGKTGIVLKDGGPYDLRQNEIGARSGGFNLDYGIAIVDGRGVVVEVTTIQNVGIVAIKVLGSVGGNVRVTDARINGIDTSIQAGVELTYNVPANQSLTATLSGITTLNITGIPLHITHISGRATYNLTNNNFRGQQGSLINLSGDLTINHVNNTWNANFGPGVLVYDFEPFPGARFRVNVQGDAILRGNGAGDGWLMSGALLEQSEFTMEVGELRIDGIPGSPFKASIFVDQTSRWQMNGRDIVVTNSIGTGLAVRNQDRTGPELRIGVSLENVTTINNQRGLEFDRVNAQIGISFFNSADCCSELANGIVISNNQDAGILLTGGTIATIRGASISRNGVGILVRDGVQATIKENQINNNVKGIVVQGGVTTVATISQNSIFANNGLGIDLGDDGVTANDQGDQDMGPNNLQNFPTLTEAEFFVGFLTIKGSLNSEPNTRFRLEFFLSEQCDPTGFGEGVEFFTPLFLTTNSSGNKQFEFTNTLPIFIPEGRVITATATGPAGKTSEFSRCQVVRHL